MAPEFAILNIPADAADVPETMGNKRKFWYRDTDFGLSLFKEARPGTGEDWAEKVASELAELLGLPHAHYELANCRGLRGTVTPSFVPSDCALMQGNELLVELVPGYPPRPPGSRRFHRVSQHTVQAVLSLIENIPSELPLDWAPPAEVVHSADVFVGFLLLDAWIGNTDRHDENWGWVIRPSHGYSRFTNHLAPTYDHASSLGRNEPEERLRARLESRDAGFSVEKYVEKCTSALYAEQGDGRPLSTLEAFRFAGLRRPSAAHTWMEKLSEVSSTAIAEVLRRVPAERCSMIAKQFASRMLELNRERLAALRGEFE